MRGKKNDGQELLDPDHCARRSAAWTEQPHIHRRGNRRIPRATERPLIVPNPAGKSRGGETVLRGAISEAGTLPLPHLRCWQNKVRRQSCRRTVGPVREQ